MEQALASGAADLIGLGRPLCVDTDAPAKLLDGSVGELTRYEDRLSLLPPWLNFLTRIDAVRAMAGFGVMYWFYAQLDELGKRGRAAPDLSVLAATRRIMGLQKQLLSER